MPSTQMRCMITANRRASATIAFFIPRCLAIFMAQALSQDDYFSCVIRLTLASHQHGIGFALINGKRGTGVSRYAPQTRI